MNSVQTRGQNMVNLRVWVLGGSVGGEFSWRRLPACVSARYQTFLPGSTRQMPIWQDSGEPNGPTQTTRNLAFFQRRFTTITLPAPRRQQGPSRRAPLRLTLTVCTDCLNAFPLESIPCTVTRIFFGNRGSLAFLA